jgi:hypothetical protein
MIRASDPIGVQQAESQRLNTAQLVPQIEQSIQIQENSLQLLTGNLPGAVRRDVNLTEIHFNDNLATGLPMSILNRRPDVRADEMALVQANALGRRGRVPVPATLTSGTGSILKTVNGLIFGSLTVLGDFGSAKAVAREGSWCL